MRRLANACAILLTALLVLAGPLASPAQDSTSPKKILVGGDFDYPPYEFLDENGRPTGYNVDLTQALARRLGIEVEFRLGPWSQVRESLLVKDLDMVQGMIYSPERDIFFNFSTPHTIVNHVIFARKGAPNIQSSQQLRGKELIVMRGDIMHDYVVERGLGPDPLLAHTQEEALAWLAQGRGDYALAAKLPGLYWINKHGWDNLVIMGPSLEPQLYCFAVREGTHAQLLARINQGLAVLNQSGAYAEIYEKWLGPLEQGWVIPPGMRTWVLAAGVLTILILGGVLAWIATLRRQVRRRTAQLEAEAEERQRAQVELRKWEQVFAHAQWGVAITSADGTRLEAVNPYYAELHGYGTEEILDIPLVRLRPEGRAEELRRHIEQVGQAGHLTFETTRRRRDGSHFPALVDVTVVRDDLGRPAYRVINVQDITERRLVQDRLKESETRLKTLLDSVPVGIMLIDWDTHRIVEVNPAALQIIGAPRAAVVGQVCHRFVCPAQEGDCPITDQGRVLDNTERELLAADGRVVPILKSAITVMIDGRKHLLESFWDVTLQKEMQAEREELIENLQQALHQVKTLQGLVPICASCKKIRDDQGYWHQIEIYIKEHTDADFSHGICPECRAKLYPDL